MVAPSEKLTPSSSSNVLPSRHLKICLGLSGGALEIYIFEALGPQDGLIRASRLQGFGAMGF